MPSVDQLEARLQREGGSNSPAVLRLLQCIIGPRLRRKFYAGSGNEGVAYVPNKLERYADNVIVATRLLWSFAVFSTPLYLVYFLIRHGIPTVGGALSTAKTLAFIPLSFSIAYVVRGVGRFKNRSYTEFLQSWNSARRLKKKIGTHEARTTGIGSYDFEMTAYPITFRHNESTVKPRRILSSRRRGLIERLINLPISFVRLVAAHYVARRLIYPGSLAIFNLLFAEGLSKGRASFKKKYDSHRARLLASDGNAIDCMLVDRRGSPDVTARGNKLVIVCEGNAAYYEQGMMEIPIGAGYSALGWNHPGFGDSSGLPFPAQEFNAIDVVMRYAVSELGFAFDDIILFAWSIGGYSASCAASSYPDVGAVILDATFDDVYPLVAARVHPILASFSRGMVKEYYDLNVAENICRYPGPILVVRRIFDEMMSVRDDLSTNRANHLLIKLLQNRYPCIVTERTLPVLWQWLRLITETERESLARSYGVSLTVCLGQLKSYMAQHGPSYPWTLGQDLSLDENLKLMLYLAGQYMINVESKHCVPLRQEVFVVPSTGNLSHH